jgi:hypothetical protein
MQANAPNSPFLRRWLAAFWTILAVLAGVIFALRFQSMLERGPYYSTTICEDISIANFSRIHQGDPVYVDCFSYPFRCSLFNWLFYKLYGTVVAVIDPSELALATVLRLVTCCWALLGAAAMFWFLQGARADVSSTADRLMDAGVAVVTWLGPTIGWWSLTARPDVPALVCEMLGLIVVIRGGAHGAWRSALTAGLLFFCAWSIKQSAVFLFAGMMLALIWRREWARAVTIAGLFGVLVSTVLLAAPPAYFSNVFEALQLAPLEPGQLAVIAFWCLSSWMPLLLAGVVLVFVGLPAASRADLFRSRPVFILSAAFGVALVMNPLFAQRLGSWGNYLFETWVGGMALTGLIQQRVTAGPYEDAAGKSVARLTGLLLACAVGAIVPLFLPGEKGLAGQGLADMTARLPPLPAGPTRLLEDLRRSPGPIFFDDMVRSITYTPPSFLVRQALGRDAAAIPVIEHTVYWDAERATSSRWPYGRLSRPDIEERIRQQQYADIWVLAEDSIWEPFVKEAGYEVVKEEAGCRQYRRPSRSASPDKNAQP